ncbi:hypothetical protein Cfor_02155 [Coptotermes formosanus]|jgi:hypothetical protein|uniref:Uncharacterized protein n=1 Tax=Coptotermes formosanus TaxID=36987 RepID=A0A6L2Q7R2_COPFO|nr:hypothetical protein Cfor_02155 [Coptotermes formosanus]
MDDRNGECFGHHEDLCFEGPINASDSEHGHLKDFLLEPRHSVRNMPCNTDSDRAEKILNVCMQTEMTGGEDLFDSCTDTVNFSSERTEDSDIPSNCVGLISSQSSYSSIVEGTNCESERNGSYHLPSLNQEDLADLSESLKGGEVRESEHNQCKEDVETENSSNLSLMVEKNTDSDKTSTECADNQICDSKELPVVSRQPNVHKLLQTESVGQEELDSAQFSEKSITPRGRNIALRGHKGKGAEVTVRGRTPGPAKKKKHSVTYQSQISPDQNGIKIRIKKSSASPTVVRPSRRRERGKKRKSKKGSNTEDECDVGSNKRVKCKDSSISVQSEVDESGEQSDWGLRLPKEILHDIFFMVTQDEGCLPFLVRLYFSLY